MRGIALVGAAVLASLTPAWVSGPCESLAAESSREVGGPDVPGLAANHKLDQRGVGSVLIGELGCASCHADLGDASARRKSAPDLSEVGSRVSPEFLRKYIAQPSAVVPGTTMPHMLDGLPPAEGQRAAEAITEFLVSIASAPLKRDPTDAVAAAAGAGVFHRVGCVACHDPRLPASDGASAPKPRAGAVALGHLPKKYTVASLSEFLYDPLAVRPSGRMPDMSLSRDEADSLAHYLLEGQRPDFEPPAREFPLADAGRQWFAKLDCASCHAVDGVAESSPTEVSGGLDGTKGCLSVEPEGVPDYKLTNDQRTSIRAALVAGDSVREPGDELAITLTTFNCISCHTRDDYGGPVSEIDPYFGSDEPSLGDQVRIPATLSETGAKLNPDWLHRVLFDRARVRPYMHTRMPQYGEANLGDLPGLFAKADPAPPIEIPVFRGRQRGQMHDAAQKLVGMEMLACINCHGFNGKKSPVMSGIDLTTTAERLQPDWFKDFLIDPQAHRPGIVMPQYWPGGESTRPDVLEGDTDTQIDAIWSYLEQGRTARDPKGIRNEPSVLQVGDEPRLYRGRSRIAGFRGIAVGFPGGMNYAFNAETGALSGIWKGGFVRARWSSQGAGDFDPDARAIQLPKDLGIARLATDDQPWPLLPVMTKEEPVNPDPLYPRRLGYRFRGYAMDDGMVPTLRYSSGDVTVSERSTADPQSITRSLRLTSARAETVYLRFAAGNIGQASESSFDVGKLRISITGGVPILRPSATEGQQELLLRLELPQGETGIEVRYEVR